MRPKKHFKNTNHTVYPFAKARREKINELQAMIFDEESAYDAQKILAPPKRKILEKINARFVEQKIVMFFWRGAFEK